MTEAWSCGGGTQSAAIAALIVRGDLPRPDLAFIVDTGREKSSTWVYLDAVLQPALAAVGVEIVRVHKDEWTGVDLYCRNGRDLLLPVWSSQSGHPSKLPTFCSGEWKRDVARRWMRAQGLKSVRLWLGISADEPQRIRDSSTSWIEHYYPLAYDHRMRRSECVRLVQEMGWPEPPRSSCWMCPNMGDREWRDLRDNWPDDFSKAQTLEASIRTRDEHAYLHRSLLPIAQADIQQQAGLFDHECSSGYCFT